MECFGYPDVVRSRRGIGRPLGLLVGLQGVRLGESGDIKEVHVVKKNVIYNHNKLTYNIYLLRDLEKIILNNVKYTQCKGYFKDAWSIDQSLFNNGIFNIIMTNAPCLKLDMTNNTIFLRGGKKSMW